MKTIHQVAKNTTFKVMKTRYLTWICCTLFLITSTVGSSSSSSTYNFFTNNTSSQLLKKSSSQPIPIFISAGYYSDPSNNEDIEVLDTLNSENGTRSSQTDFTRKQLAGHTLTVVNGILYFVAGGTSEISSNVPQYKLYAYRLSNKQILWEKNFKNLGNVYFYYGNIYLDTTSEGDNIVITVLNGKNGEQLGQYIYPDLPDHQLDSNIVFTNNMIYLEIEDQNQDFDPSMHPDNPLGGETNLIIGLSSNAHQVFQQKIPRKIDRVTAINNTLFYLENNQGKGYILYAYSTATHQQLWQKSIPLAKVASFISSTGQEHIYLQIRTNTFIPESTLIALNPKDGSLLWQKQYPTVEPITGLLIDNGILYTKIESSPNEIIALSQANGSILWQKAISSDSNILPASGNGVVYIEEHYAGVGKYLVYAIEGRSGNEIWCVSMGGGLIHGALFDVSSDKWNTCMTGVSNSFVGTWHLASNPTTTLVIDAKGQVTLSITPLPSCKDTNRNWLPCTLEQDTFTLTHIDTNNFQAYGVNTNKRAGTYTVSSKTDTAYTGNSVVLELDKSTMAGNYYITPISFVPDWFEYPTDEISFCGVRGC